MKGGGSRGKARETGEWELGNVECPMSKFVIKYRESSISVSNQIPVDQEAQLPFDFK